MRFSVGCEIGYDIGEAATLIFNIEAMRGGRQRVISEELTITPNLVADEYKLTEVGRREAHHEIGVFAVELVEDLTGHFADRVSGQRML